MPSRQKASVTAGLKCAPERLPIGDRISASAVNPIAMPMNMRRTNGIGSASTIGEAGRSSSIVQKLAETMKSPRSVASMRYSGQ